MIRLVMEDDLPEPSLADLIHELQNATELATLAAQHKQAAQELVLERLQREQFKSKTVDDLHDTSKQVRAVYVANRRVEINDLGLKRQLGARVWHKYTDEKVNKSLLEAGIAAGEIDQTTIQQYITVTEHPTVRLYVLDRKAEESDDLAPE